MSRQLANALFAVIFFAFAFLHFYRLGAVTPTWDEGSDLGVVSCLQRTHDPFACLDDISQTRLPFYIHALAHRETTQYLISFLFATINLVVLYAFARREFGLLAATLTAALYATSPAVLASGRMLLTHSNVIFTTFSLLSFVSIYEFAKKRVLPIPSEAKGRNPLPTCGGDSSPSPRLGMTPIAWLAACAMASGAAVGSHALGLFNVIVIAIFYVAAVRPRRVRDVAVYALISAATFFATTIVYVKVGIFRQLVIACLHPGAYPFWNYLGLGTATAPWYFPFVILLVKLGPWLLFGGGCFAVYAAQHDRGLQKTFLASFAAGFLVDLLLKSFVFHYEAPHHQVQFYPILYLLIGVAIASAWRPVVAVIVAALFAWQLYDVVRFFPNYLFYGAQYGERMIGEFYGPAVMHAQDRGPLNAYVDALLAREPNAKILVADNNALDRSGPNFVLFSKRDPSARYDYAFVDRLYSQHFHFPERDAYNRYLAENYAAQWTYFFPPHVWMYRIIRLRWECDEL